MIFCILSSGGLLYAAVFGRRYEEALPLTCAAAVLILLALAALFLLGKRV